MLWRRRREHRGPRRDDAEHGGRGRDQSARTTTISDLNEDLAAGGIECELEYEGLADEVRELSQCTIDGGLAILTIWYDDGLMNDFLAPEGAEPPVAVAYGEDWTVELTDPATAATVAEAAGGTTTDG